MAQNKKIPLSLRRRLALDITSKVYDHRVEEHQLRQLFWECTLKCNLNCRHCGSDCKTIAGQRDMPMADFLNVLDQVKTHTDPHHVFVVITGGEPLMRDDLEECGREIFKREFAWGMVTNGLYLTRERFNALLQSGLRTMTVSLDGDEADHTWMRRNPHSYEMVLNTIKMAVRVERFIFDVVTCVNRRNYSHLNEIKELLISNGVKRWRVFTVFPVGRAANEPELQLTSDEFRGVFEFIKNTRKEGQIALSYGCEGFLGNYEGAVRDNFFFCNAGVNTASVLSDGSISGCPSIRANYHQGNIYEDDFWEVWNSRFDQYRNREWMKTDECKACKYFRYCRGNGMHLRDDDGKLLFCHLKRLTSE